MLGLYVRLSAMLAATLLFVLFGHVFLMLFLAFSIAAPFGVYLSVVPSDAHRLRGEATFGNDCKARLAEEKSTSHRKVSRNLAAKVFRRSDRRCLLERERGNVNLALHKFGNEGLRPLPGIG